MKNKNNWTPSKYVLKKGKLMASRDSTQVSVSSRFTVDLSAKLFQTYIPKFAKGLLLDLGCGKVPLYGIYRPYIEDNICIDWGNSAHQNNHLDLELDLNNQLPLENNQFDTIILSSVLEHLKQPNQIFKEMKRILKPNGSVLLSVPFYYNLHEVPHDYFRFTKYALQMLSQENELKVKHLEAYGGIPEIMADLGSKTLIKIPYLGKWLAIFYQFCVRIFILTSFGERFSKKTSEKFPLAYFVVLQN